MFALVVASNEQLSVGEVGGAGRVTSHFALARAARGRRRCRRRDLISSEHVRLVFKIEWRFGDRHVVVQLELVMRARVKRWRRVGRGRRGGGRRRRGRIDRRE